MFSYTATPVPDFKGLDYVIHRGVEAMEAEHRRQIAALREVITKMGEFLEVDHHKAALAIYREYKADQ